MTKKLKMQNKAKFYINQRSDCLHNN